MPVTIFNLIFMNSYCASCVKLFSMAGSHSSIEPSGRRTATGSLADASRIWVWIVDIYHGPSANKHSEITFSHEYYRIWTDILKPVSHISSILKLNYDFSTKIVRKT